MSTFIHPGLLDIWQKNFDRLPLKQQWYIQHAADLLIAETAKSDPEVKRTLIAAWLNEVAYDSETRLARRVHACAGWPGCICKDGWGHKSPSVHWRIAPEIDVFTIIRLGGTR